MKEKKHIDQLFKERFENFEATPSPKVWEHIHAQLQKDKKDRKIIPLWIKLGGVAALLALLFTVGNSVFNSSKNPVPSFSTEEIKTPAEPNSKILQNENEQPSGITSEDVKTLENENGNDSEINSTKKEVSTENNSRTGSASKSAIAGENEKGQSIKDQSNPLKNQKEQIQNKIINPNKNRINEAIVSESENKSPEKNPKSFLDKEIKISENTTGITVETKEKEPQIENKIDAPEVEIEKSAIVKTEESKNKKSLLEVVAAQEKEKTIDKKPKLENRWLVAPNVAPVYYSSLGNGSSLDPAFADNQQSGNVNMSYGVQVSYALSERLSIRSGISNVDLSYSTGGIELGTGPVALALRSVDYGNSDIVLTAVDKGDLAHQPPGNGFGNIVPKSIQGNAEILQNINYYEVPLELKYAVFNNKLGVNIIGGVSTLFLGNDEISVKADNFNSVLGEANNLSSVSFSTNIGLGLDYKLSKRFLFNIEPMFKYQLNPYTDSSVNFKPYYIGVYTGFSFKF